MTGYNSQTAKGDYRLQFETDDYDKFRYVEEAARRCIDNKHIEVAPVVHAFWVRSTYIPSGTRAYICSRCGRDEPNEEPYCNCGAKMY